MNETVKDILATAKKKFGNDIALTLDERPQKVDVIPTLIPTIDWALGIGGIPRGRITEIYGPESSGKTTLAQYIIASAQKLGLVTAYIDMEHALDPEYARICGVDTDNMILSQPQSGEEALQFAEFLARTGKVGLIVIDSVAALVPQKENEADMGDSVMGQQARLLNQAMRKLTPVTALNNVALIFTNQIRQKIGIVFGNPETTPGGMGLRFYASLRLEVRRSTQIKDGVLVQGNTITVKVVKNKLAPPFKKTTFNIMYGKGPDTIGNTVDLAVEAGTVVKRGGHFYYGETKIGHGKDNVREYLTEEKALFEKILSETLEKAGNISVKTEEEEPVD